ncbi:hypothetical protein OROMI_027278 [Orobanche minor]
MEPTLLLVVALVFAISMEGTLGSIECKNLNEDSCAYAVSSTGRRCVLEKLMIGGGYTCGASEIVADKLINDWIETEDCISACGVDRKALGISSDSLLDSRFSGKLCSVECYRGCPNIVDLYFNLAAGEGVFLPKLCEALGSNGITGERKLIFGKLLKGAPIPWSQPYVGSGTNGPLAAIHRQEVSLKKATVPRSGPGKWHNKKAAAPRSGPPKGTKRPPPPPTR